MVELKWTPEAEVSLRDIYDYIARDRPRTALQTVQSILHRAESLREYPKLGKPYPYHPDRPIRTLTYGEFQIVYLLEGERALVVLGVFHGLIFLPLK